MTFEFFFSLMMLAANATQKIFQKSCGLNIRKYTYRHKMLVGYCEYI